MSVHFLALSALIACSVQTEARVTRTATGLAYDRAGSGPTIVLIHGAFLDRRMWDREFAWLRTRADVVRYDQRGHGESPLPDGPFSPVDDLLALLDELKIARATLVGLSSGAQLALDAALASPDRIERVVMAAPAISGYVERERPAFMADLMTALQAKDYRRATEVMLATPIYAAPAASRPLVRDMLTRNERLWGVDPRDMRRPEPALPRLEQVRVPVVVLVGDQDQPAMLEQAEIVQSRVRRSRLVRLAGGGHLLNLTAPEAFEKALAEALALRPQAAVDTLDLPVVLRLSGIDDVHVEREIVCKRSDGETLTMDVARPVAAGPGSPAAVDRLADAYEAAGRDADAKGATERSRWLLDEGPDVPASVRDAVLRTAAERLKPLP